MLVTCLVHGVHKRHVTSVTIPPKTIPVIVHKLPRKGFISITVLIYATPFISVSKKKLRIKLIPRDVKSVRPHGIRASQRLTTHSSVGGRVFTCTKFLGRSADKRTRLNQRAPHLLQLPAEGVPHPCRHDEALRRWRGELRKTSTITPCCHFVNIFPVGRDGLIDTPIFGLLPLSLHQACCAVSWRIQSCGTFVMEYIFSRFAASAAWRTAELLQGFPHSVSVFAISSQSLDCATPR